MLVNKFIKKPLNNPIMIDKKEFSENEGEPLNNRKCQQLKADYVPKHYV